MCLVKNQEDTFVKLHSALYQRAGKCRDELVYLSRYKLKPCKRVCCVCVRVCVCVCVCVCFGFREWVDVGILCAEGNGPVIAGGPVKRFVSSLSTFLTPTHSFVL